jgi:phenylalanyl-tRNA synthetase beta chain
MHAFDAREISSNRIVVERAAEGEKFTTLDGTERTLTDSVLNIKNGEKTIGLAGIMGGENSEIKDDTTEVVFECATFDGTNIRISSGKLGLRTEASSRFEKDLDPNMAEVALNRACHLIEELNAGDIIEGTIDVYPEKPSKKVVTVDSNWVNTFLGTDIPKEDMKEYLDRLELETAISGDELIISVPSFRNDINIREDVAEEVARIYGYNNIPATIAGSAGTRDAKSRKQHLDDKVIAALLGSGLNQSISYSFVSPKVFDKIMLPMENRLRKAVVIKNPLGEDFSIMRTTSIPSMMESLSRNYSRNNEEARLFEIGKVYIPDEDASKLPNEINTVTIGLYGAVDYFDLKGIVENILSSIGISGVSFERESENRSFHPGKTASINIKKKTAGILGEVHPDVTENYGIDARCYIAELNLDVLYELSDIERKYKALPKFPAVTRDMALLVDDSVLVQEIENIILKQSGSIVEKIKLFDVYKGKQIPEGKKSIAYSITYRHEDKTLTDEEVSKVHDRIVRTLENKLGAELR